jgi:hypothetical protein
MAGGAADSSRRHRSRFVSFAVICSSYAAGAVIVGFANLRHRDANLSFSIRSSSVANVPAIQAGTSSFSTHLAAKHLATVKRPRTRFIESHASLSIVVPPNFAKNPCREPGKGL